jgi:hypothetical protein
MFNERMHTSIELTSFNKTVTYSISDTGLVRRIKLNRSESEFHFTFEQLSTNRLSVDSKNDVLLLVAGGVGGFGMLMMFSIMGDDMRNVIAASTMLIPGVALFFVYLFTRRRKIRLLTTDHHPIDFDVKKHSIDKVNDFIDILFKERNEYLSSKYGIPTRNLDYAVQLNNFNWLLSTRAISKQAYDDKIKELNALFGSTASTKPIGFNIGN